MYMYIHMDLNIFINRMRLK